MVPSARHSADESGWQQLPVHARFARACDSACAAAPQQVVEQRFTVAGRSAGSRIAGTVLAGIFARAMIPTAAPPSAAPELRLDLWDGAATGVPAPARVDDDPYPDRSDSGERFMLSPDGRHGRLSSPDFELHLDRAAAHIVGWVAAADRLAYWHRARPLRSLLTPWMADRGCAVVHAAMVAREGRGLVLAAPSHSGKSTCAAACGAAGFDVLGDDTTALEPRDGGAVGHAVHTAVKLRRNGLDRHGALASRVADAGFPWADDAVAYIGELFAGPPQPTARVTAIAFPELGPDGPTRFERVGRAVAVRRLTGCVLSVDPADLGAAFEHVAAIVSDVPAYRLTVGQDTAAIPAATAALLADAEL